MIIRPFDNADFEEVLDLHKQCFGKPFGWDENFYKENLDLYKQFFDATRTIVAHIDDKIVGFTCYMFFDSDFLISPDPDKFFDDCITMDDDGRQRIEKKLSEQMNKFGLTEIVLETFPNEFSQNAYKTQSKDYEVSSIAVLPEYRTQGIGKALIKEGMRIATDYGSIVAFARCWEGGHSPTLFKSLGFIPIVRIGPEYSDGTCALAMGKYLR